MLLLLAGLLIVSVGIYFLKKSRRDALKPMPVTTTLAAMFFMAG
jgi:LPXTG-motif cell wall-anchored protein